MSPPQTSAERQRARDAQLRARGLTQRKVWAHPDDWPTILSLVERLQRARESSSS